MDQGRGDSSNDKAQWWREVLGEQEVSGLSVRQFCGERGLALSQFYYWRRRLAEASTMPPLVEACPEAGRTPAFVELGLGASAAARVSSPLEIRLDLGGGCVLEIRRG
jgi:hypothetical protein